LRTIGPVEIVRSEAARDEARLATDAAHAGARALAVVGGDGTISHAARGLLAAGDLGRALPLALFSAGSGNDFAASLGAPTRDFLAMAALVRDEVTRRIDVGTMDDVPFMNVAGVGFDVDVLALLSGRASARGLPRDLAYAVTAAKHLRRFRPFAATLSTDARGWSARPWLLAAFANGRRFGGRFVIAPNARVDDGVLTCVGVRDGTMTRRLRVFAAALRGRHGAEPEVEMRAAERATIRSDAPLMFQADGELHRARGREIAVECLPGALTVVGPVR
jgi:diacylglycerol kinase (ATP)